MASWRIFGLDNTKSKYSPGSQTVGQVGHKRCNTRNNVFNLMLPDKLKKNVARITGTLLAGNEKIEMKLSSKMFENCSTGDTYN